MNGRDGISSTASITQNTVKAGGNYGQRRNH
jgi:hypothetical protein